MKALLLSMSLSAAALVSADGAVVLTVEISNSGYVIIASAPGFSQAAGSLFANFNGGVTMEGFFSQAQSLPVTPKIPVVGTWSAGGGASFFDQVISFTFGSEDISAGRDLNFFNSQADDSVLMNFSTSSAAFTGSSAFDLSSFDFFPAVGSTGNLRLGYKNDEGHGAIIGQYLVIPEPSCTLLIMAAVAGGAVLRRRVAA